MTSVTDRDLIYSLRNIENGPYKLCLYECIGMRLCFSMQFLNSFDMHVTFDSHEHYSL